ncbi:hypothetical protein [Yoonia sp. 2307UL14-13]|uniref:hypothetical protein n=1 Tax=Yoonia sp. 2307UL14-13 TaxID=3126506 RepID=UPI00309CA19A
MGKKRSSGAFYVENGRAARRGQGEFFLGEKSKRLASFIESHPFCAFCGGDVPTQTIEHCPPRVFFLGKQRPKSHEYPACQRCNHGSSAGDQIAALSAYIMGSALNQELPFEHFEKLYSGVRNNQPEAIDYFGGNDQNIWAKVNGLFIPLVKTSVDNQIFHDWLNPWAAKLGYALWYEHHGSALPETGGVGVRWMTNESILQGKFPNDVFQQLGHSGEVRQGNWSTSKQFFYRYGVNEKERFAFFMPIMFESCGVLLYAFENKEQLARFPKMAAFSTSASEGISPLVHS